MAELKTDPFVSIEPAVEVDSETRRTLEERVKSAEAGRLVSAEEARQRIHQWLADIAFPFSV